MLYLNRHDRSMNTTVLLADGDEYIYYVCLSIIYFVLKYLSLSLFYTLSHYTMFNWSYL